MHFLSFRFTCMAALLLLGGGVAVAEFQPLPLERAANTSRMDESADDRKGGWTDQGSNDMRLLPAGNLTAGDIRFQIPAEKAGVSSCIVLGDRQYRSYLPRKASLSLDQPVSGSTLYLFHACGWGKTETVAGRLTAAYDDNTTQEWRVRVGRDVMDWWSGVGASNAYRVWSVYNNNTQISLFASKFALKEGRTLKALHFESDDAVWMVVAASVGDDVTVKPLRRDWKLSRDYDAPAPLDPALLAAAPAAVAPRNIIFIIGDGMGQSAQKFASLHAHGAPGKLVMESLPVAGMATTFSANAAVTDSAASGTALAGGYKTNNGMLGMNPAQKMFRTIAEEARDAGKSVGLLTTDALTGATPAAFVAHVPSRGMAIEIAEFTAGSGFDLLWGGNRKAFLPPPAGIRKDGRDLTAEMTQKGYSEVKSAADVAKSTGRVFGFEDRWKEDIRLLSQVSRAAFEKLSANPNGFFLMVECSYPDYGGHGNNPDLSVLGVLTTDFVVRTAVDFAAQRKDTLVVVTADHETGGIFTTYNRTNPKRPWIIYTATGHTGSPVNIFAYGPGAENFQGTLDNTEISATFAKLWSLPLGRPFGK